jgi:hypothetical protein
MLPVTPAATVPPGFVSHPPGLGPGMVTKLPFLNCSTTVKVPSLFGLTVKWRSNVSVAQSLPQVLESVSWVVYGP